MPGRINQVIVEIVVSQLREACPKVQKEAAEALLKIPFDDGFPLAPYRAYLRKVADACGGHTILAAGQALKGVSDPFLFVLLNSDSVPLVIEKEARLGRFIHSRHVVRLQKILNNGVILEHVSNESEDPLPEESLASAGLHISLLEQLGCSGLRLKFPSSNEPNLWVYDDGAFAPFGERTSVHKWQFEWTHFSPARLPMEGLDSLLLSGEDRPELAEAPAVVLDILQVVKVDMAKTWTITDVARDLKMSPRTLQRLLTLAGTSFSKVIGQWRLSAAKRLLETTELSVTDIGYICGFSDTSHFSRRFKECYGKSPSAFSR